MESVEPANRNRDSTNTRGTGLIAVLALAGLIAAMSQTIVVPLIPALPQLLHTSPAAASWVVTAALLAGAAINPIVGRLGDAYGRQRALLLSLALLTCGSVMSALSDSLLVSVLGRALQGCALGSIPLAMSILNATLPPRRVSSAVALLAAMPGIGAALGLPAAALIVSHGNWHLLYWASAAVSILVFLLVGAVVPKDAGAAGHDGFDTLGVVGLIVGLSCVLLSISQADAWPLPRTLGLGAAGVAVLVAWGFWEVRRTAPLVDLRVSTRRTVLLANVAAVLIGFATYAVTLTLSQLLELPRGTGGGLGQSEVTAALLIAPSGIVIMLVSPLAGRAISQWGPKRTLTLGSAIMALGWSLGLLAMGSALGVALTACVIATGISLAASSTPSLVMAAVPTSQTAAANGLNSLMRSFGTSTCSTVIAAVLISGGAGAAGASHASFQHAFLCAAAAAAVALLITSLLPPSRTRSAVSLRPDASNSAKTTSSPRLAA